MSAQLPPNSDGAQASASQPGNPSPKAEAGSPTRAHPQQPGGLDPQIQSQLDKRDARILTQFQDLKALIEKMGTAQAPQTDPNTSNPPISPPPSPPAQPASPPAAETRQPETITQPPPSPSAIAAYAVMDGEGVEIDEADPEAQLIDWKTPDAAYRTTRAAIAAKQKRLANASLPLSGGTPGVNPIANVKDTSQLFKIAKETGKF